MKPKWFIGANCYDDGNPERIKEACEKEGCEVHFYKYFPLLPNTKLFSKFNTRDFVVAYGSIELIKLVQRESSWSPCDWAIWDDLKCTQYLHHWGKFSIHHTYGYLPVSEIIRQKDFIFANYANDGKVFFRPDSNTKGYAGKGFYAEVCHINNWDKFIKDGFNYPYELDGSILAMFSTPTTIFTEWRLVVAKRKVITGSQYKKRIDSCTLSTELEAGYPPEVEAYAEMIMASSEYEPAPIYIMDIASTIDGLKLLEIGAVNCAGLYCCDIEKFVQAVNDVAEFSMTDNFVGLTA